MKTLHVPFTDEEYQNLLKVKNKEKLSWHDFILKLTNKEDAE